MDRKTEATCTASDFASLNCGKPVSGHTLPARGQAALVPGQVNVGERGWMADRLGRRQGKIGRN